MTVPNLISLFRLVLVPFVLWALVEELYAYALLSFVVAGLSDLLDGFIARKMHCQTKLGRLLDPAADKMLLVVVYITLGVQGVIPTWLIILIVFRDFIILSGSLLVTILKEPVEIKPLFISKANTAMQILLVGIVLLELSLDIWSAIFNNALFMLTAITTLLSGTAYVKTMLAPSNSFSFFRLFFAPIIIWTLVQEYYLFALISLAVAIFLDIADHLLAEVKHWDTTFRHYLEPIADKVLLATVLIILGIQDLAPLWFVILILFRDLIIISAAATITVLKGPLDIKPLLMSRASTVLQFLLVTVIITEKSFDIFYPTTAHFLFILTATTTLLSGALYVKNWIEDPSKIDDKENSA